MTTRRKTIEVFKGTDGQWYWHLRAGNGEIVTQSEGYTRKASALRAAKREYPTARVEEL
jgi:uncharacterized protein YegP (UPF0339 family)